MFECMVFLHLRSLAQLLVPPARIYYWRTTTEKEIDLVLEHGRRLLPVEVKLTSNPKYKDAEVLHLFMGEYPEARSGVLKHAGTEIRLLDEGIVALPWTLLAGV
ncbi:MAG: DUF4143 domain-containing protein [Actinobacteria bacterium]|nr:DUF4143 domain-containing protein [Actinomycetota bacterium]MBU4489388.1 DUF4143 domain-containing protein [Actinomycetota bacterium]